MTQDEEQLLKYYKKTLQYYASIPGEVGNKARVALDGPLILMDSPYLITYKAELNYNPAFGDDRICKCGHEYEKHFDPYDNYERTGCKYCECLTFICEEQYMPWKLFLDDERDPIGDDWIVCRDVYEAIVACADRGLPEYVSFDHDLGDSNKDFNTGYSFAHWIIDNVLDGRWELPKNFSWYVHSQNPIGAENINALLQNFIKTRNR